MSRQDITLMENIAHEYLGHKPSLRRDGTTGLMLREFSKSPEKQAYGVAADGAATRLGGSGIDVGAFATASRRGGGICPSSGHASPMRS